jgi:hypothetical protein
VIQSKLVKEDTKRNFEGTTNIFAKKAQMCLSITCHDIVTFSVILMCATKADEHNIMLEAQARGMTNPEYLYISLDHIPPDDIATPWAGLADVHKGREDELFEAYKSVLQVWC